MCTYIYIYMYIYIYIYIIAMEKSTCIAANLQGSAHCSPIAMFPHLLQAPDPHQCATPEHQGWHLSIAGLLGHGGIEPRKVGEIM